MENRIYKFTVHFLLALLLLSVALLGVLDWSIPDAISVFESENPPSRACISYVDCGATYESEGRSVRTLSARLFGVIPVKRVELNVYENVKLCPGGMPFGIKLDSRGVIVVGLSEVKVSGRAAYSPAEKGGVRIKDTIIKINGREVSSNRDVNFALDDCGGSPVELVCLRGGKEITLRVNPAQAEDGSWRLGVWLRDSMSGIGTVTYIDPTSGAFGGLGHGVCDADTGELLPIRSGSALLVKIIGIAPGKEGAPGEIRGYLKSDRIGKITKNSVCGVFGYFSGGAVPTGEAIPIALKSQLREGEAHILSTLDDGGVGKYRVEISDIKLDGETKCFTVKVTDPALLAKTGGIVQGMSGSPIIQNGKLVGAVTHVLVSDPTSGYGIFIENMLAQMES